MEVKKSPKADLEKNVGISVLLGLLVAISLVFISLQWKSQMGDNVTKRVSLNIADLDQQLLIPDQEKPKEPEPPKPKVQQEIKAQLPEEFKVVDNNKKVQAVSFVSSDEAKKLPPPPPPGPSEDESAQKIFEVVEQEPQFPGGLDALMNWLHDHMHYPDVAAENGIQGRVYLQFVVERDGSITQVKVVRGVDPALDKEAVRVVKAMPKWKPGMQQGKPVRTRFTLPVVFRLQ